MNKLDKRAIWLFFSVLFLTSTVLITIIEFFLIVVRKKDSLASQTLPVFLWWWLATLPVLALFSYIWARLEYNNYRYELGDDTFHQESGVIMHESLTIPYQRIQAVDIIRGPIARMLGLSTIIIRTAGTRAGAKGHPSPLEGQIPGITFEEAITLRDQIISKTRQTSHSGL